MNTENAGRRIRLVYMRGDEKIQSGDEGTVKYEDDMGQIHVQWDNGSTLAIIPEVDEFEWIGESIKKFSDFIVEKKSDSVVLKSKSDKGNRLFNQLKTRLFQHYDMPKGELSTIYGGEEKRKKIVSKLSKEDNKELKLMAYGRPHIAVEDRNGNFLLCGLEHGMEVTGGSIATGTAFGDLSGYSLTLTGQELEPANFISGGTAADPFAGMSSATVTVTVGTNS